MMEQRLERCALKMKEGATSQGMPVASKRKWIHRQGNGFSSGASQINAALLTP